VGGAVLLKYDMNQSLQIVFSYMAACVGISDGAFDSSGRGLRQKRENETDAFNKCGNIDLVR
jgi:hypothetical protein